uniref:Integrase/recombinase XerD n=1 Tax=Candidatus Kentrum sp. MB TaxID=2138164 RepID=A0A450XGN0_9GAMM|nr:MAG: integrase/recombinase XerD [Candidatus Kentron sp. MB]VFK28394.1 MAG: integrase/recombinase XerD [Candidatus Kentron sp. MB]VFK74232.1 MAG: integrase/recombinase XerD [Candidatus Kentron sp. MB]
MKISRACDDYLEFCRHQKQLSEHSLRAYVIDLSEFQRFAGSSLLIIDCDKYLLRNYTRHLLTERGLKEASAKRRIACLKALFRWLETEDLLENNPFHKAAIKIKLPSRLPRSLGKHEVRNLLRTPLLELGFKKRENCHGEALLAAAQSHHGHLQFTTLVSLELLFATGVRVGELVNIRLEELNLEESTIYIHGKGDRERVVFLPDQLLLHLLRDYLTHRTTLSPNHVQVLVNTRGGPATPQFIRHLVTRTGEDAKLTRRVTPHMLRHTCATHLLDAGLDMRYVQKLLGHQSVTTTEIYTHVDKSKLKELIRSKFMRV